MQVNNGKLVANVAVSFNHGLSYDPIIVMDLNHHLGDCCELVSHFCKFSISFEGNQMRQHSIVQNVHSLLDVVGWRFDSSAGTFLNIISYRPQKPSEAISER